MMLHIIVVGKEYPPILDFFMYIADTQIGRKTKLWSCGRRFYYFCNTYGDNNNVGSKLLGI